MRTYVLTHVPDPDLLQNLDRLVAQGRENTAETLAHIAEVDDRGLYISAGYPSMYAYCVDRLHMSEDAAFKRIHAARTARQFPVLFAAVADGRLHMTAVRLLAAYLTPENVNELVAEATHKRNTDIQEILARRFPRPEMLPQVVPSVSPVCEQAPGPARAGESESCEQAPGPARAGFGAAVPLSSEHYRVEFEISRSTYDKLRYAQDLAGVAPGEMAKLFEKALDALIEKRERRKFAATTRPRTPAERPRSGRPRAERHVPPHVRRAVWKRDGARCTFVGDDGHRCSASKFVEFDHVVPVARGGRPTKDSMRLRCRAHNQFEAERVFGREFMQRKREQARKPADDMANDLMAGLRELGVGVDMARKAVEYSREQGGRTFEERMKAALQFLCPKGVRVKAFVAA